MARILRILLVCGAVSAVAPVLANAEQRFVTTGGSGVTCSEGTPCGIVTGVNSANSNDEVIVGPGTYTLSTPLSFTSGLTVRGRPGQPRPVISSSAGTALSLSGNASHVADLEIVHTGAFIGLYAFANGSSFDRVVVRSSGFDACYAGPVAVVRDSVCVATAPNGHAFNLSYSAGGGTSELRLRNLTAIATGAGSIGVRTAPSGSTTLNVDGREVIAQGSADDISAEVSGFTTTNVVTMGHSNYDTTSPAVSTASVTPPGTATNQAAPPLFADTSLYHQAAGSPTVDAGVTEPDGGAVDLDGDPRALGAANDIGADEAVPPPPPGVDSTPPETSIHKHPNPRPARRSATFTFSSNEPGSSFECRLDRPDFAACTSPVKRKRLARRKHKFAVRAIDAAGNVDPTPATYKWKIKKKRAPGR